MFDILNKLYWRFVAPMPLAYKITHYALNISLCVGGVQEIVTMFGIKFPSPYDILTYKLFFFSAATASFLCRLTVKKPQTNETQKN